MWLELKNKSEEHLVGEPRYGSRKMKLVFPNTHGKKHNVQFGLTKHLLNDKHDYRARFLALSDPRGVTTIHAIGFGK